MAEAFGIAEQLLGCVEQLRTLCRALRDTPGELQGILDEREILGEVFYQLGALRTDSSQPEYSALQASLEHCRRAASKLEAAVTRNALPLQENKKRPWYLMKAVLKREEVKELKDQLEAKKSLLHLAMTCYLLSMQQQYITLLEVRNIDHIDPLSAPTLTTTGGPNTSILPQSSSNALELELSRPQMSLHFSRCAPGKCHCACHTTKTHSGRFWSLKIPNRWNSCDRRTCSNYRNASIWVSLSSIGIPYSILASLNFLFSTQQSYITPSLSVQHVVDWDSPAFALLDIRDLDEQLHFEGAREQLTKLFESGRASPLDVLPDGKSMVEKLLILPWPNGDTQLKLLEFLVMAGCQLNTAGVLRRCASWKGLGKWKTGQNNQRGGHTHLLNRIVSLGFDPSEVEAPFSERPRECSPIPAGYRDLDGDGFFVDWIAEGVKVFPGFAGSTPLQEAILIDSTNAVRQKLIQSPLDSDQNILRQTSLHLAVWRPQHLALILERGFDVNAQDWTGRTPLMYAAEAGCIETAISLLRSGADPWIQDDLFGSHNFINYAVRSCHWEFVMVVLDFIRQSALFPQLEVESLLNIAVVLWAGAVWERRSNDLVHLLNWGADPEVRFTDIWRPFKAYGNTLLHSISLRVHLDSLVSSGFRSFNHPNSSGSHGLMAIVGLQTSVVNAQDPHLVQNCIASGSSVNHQDNLGRTSLHVVTEAIWESFLFRHFNYSRLRAHALNCGEVLLSNMSDPFLGDHCRCACSNNGCTPSHVLLKEHRQITDSDHYKLYPLGQYAWLLEWLELVRSVQGVECVRRSLHDMTRLRRFEELELTHTCCRKPLNARLAHKGEQWTTLDEDEVGEIRDEEKEIISVLESKLKDVELGFDPDLDETLQEELCKLLKVRAINDRISILAEAPGVPTEGIACLVKEYYDFTSMDDYARWTMSSRQGKFSQGESGTSWIEQRERWISRLKTTAEHCNAGQFEQRYYGNILTSSLAS